MADKNERLENSNLKKTVKTERTVRTYKGLPKSVKKKRRVH